MAQQASTTTISTASIADRAELITAIGTLSHRSSDTGVTAQIPLFIAAAEALIARRVRAQEMIVDTTLTDTDRVSGPKYILPADYLAVRRVYGSSSGTDYVLRNVSLDELRAYGASARPVFFSVYGSTIEFRGTPATGVTFDLIYYARPAALDEAANTNNLLQLQPFLYVHGALHYLYIFTQDIELAQAHATAFNELADALNELAREGLGTPRAPAANNLANWGIRSTM